MQIRNCNYVVMDKQPPSEAGGIHPSFELLYVTLGSFQLHWQGITYELGPGALLLLTPNTPHHLVNKTPYVGYWYIELVAEEEEVMPVDLLMKWNRMQSGIQQEVACSELLTLSTQSIQSEIQTYREQNSQELHDLLILEIRKLLLLIRIALSSLESTDLRKKTRPLRSVQDWIKPLLFYLEVHYRNEISLMKLAELSHVHENYLIRKFKEQVGIPPMQYVHNLRMNAATSYLATTDMTIQEIAEASGFSTLHHFSQAFKRNFGVSPSEWRKQARKLESN